MTDHTLDAPEPDEPEPQLDLPEFDNLDTDYPDDDEDYADDALPTPPHPINWNVLSASDAEHEWLTLNTWVHWLRRTYGLPATIIPPAWHRHPELVWELSALHLHWLGAYDPEQDGSAPIGWHADFDDARERLRDWVAASGTRLDRDRPTRVTDWPGEELTDQGGETTLTDREQDFIDFLTADVKRRQQREDDWLRGLAGESQ